MVDRDARDKYSEIVIKFASGQMSNFDFEKKVPLSNDAVIDDIFKTLWCFYDDFKKHHLSGDSALSEEALSHIERWIIFLKSDEEYMWPSNVSCPGFFVPKSKYTFWDRLFKTDVKEQEFMKAGDYSVWPFIDKASYEKAKRDFGDKLDIE